MHCRGCQCFKIDKEKGGLCWATPPGPKGERTAVSAYADHVMCRYGKPEPDTTRAKVIDYTILLEKLTEAVDRIDLSHD